MIISVYAAIGRKLVSVVFVLFLETIYIVSSISDGSFPFRMLFAVWDHAVKDMRSFHAFIVSDVQYASLNYALFLL